MKTIKRILIVSILLSLHLCLFAQEPEWISFTASHNVNDIKEEGDVLWLATTGGVIKMIKETGEQEHFTSSNSGLCDNRVTSIAIEADGKKWFTTINGVSSFDGVNWENHSHEFRDGVIRDVTIDNQGNIWFGTQNSGCVSFGGSQWTLYYDSEYNQASSVTEIVVDGENTIWFATFGRGLYKYKDKQWTRFTSSNSELPSDYIFDLTVNTDQSIWFTLNTGVYKIEHDLITQVSSDAPQCLAIDLDGNQWFGFRSGGICQYKDDGVHLYPYIPALSGKEVKSIEIASNGDLWIGTNDGIVNFNHSSSQYFNTATSGLTDSGVLHIHIDANGNKWIGTNNGVSMLSGSEWVSFSDYNSPFHRAQVGSITSDLDGNVWLGTNKGIGMFDGVTMNVFDHENSPVPYTIFTDIDVDPENGTIWFASYGGVLSYDGTNWTNYTTDNSSLPSNSVSSVAIESSGVKWFGTNNGLAKLDNSTWNVFNSSNTGVDIEYINAISIDKDQKKWVYTNQFVFEYDDINWTKHAHLDYRWRGEMHVGSGNDKWFTGGQGLTRFTGAYYEHYTMDNSDLPANWCFSFAIDDKGNKWIATVGGVGVYNETGVDLSSTPTSLHSLQSTSVQEISLSPNPATNFVDLNFPFIKGQSINSQVSVDIFEITGKHVKHETSPYLEQIRVNIIELAPGIYIIKIKYEDKLGQVKFIKK